MRSGVAVLLLALLLLPGAQAHTVGSPAYVNLLLSDFETPDLAPGESGAFRFTVANPYPWEMRNIALRLEVYRYVEIDVDRPVDATWTGPGPDFLDSAGINRGQAIEPLVPDLPPDNATEVVSTVVTYADTPHGSLTKQGSYFVRTRVEFELTDGTTTNESTMMSKGWFTDEEWDTARRTCPSTTAYCVGLLNMTFLGSVYGLDHLDGLLPDTAFSVKDRMPLWPFALVSGVMVASLGFAVLFYAEENPGKLPRLAQWWLGVKGKTHGVRPPKPK